MLGVLDGALLGTALIEGAKVKTLPVSAASSDERLPLLWDSTTAAATRAAATATNNKAAARITFLLTRQQDTMMSKAYL